MTLSITTLSIIVNTLSIIQLDTECSAFMHNVFHAKCANKPFMMNVINAECRYAKCHYAECRYAKCHYAEFVAHQRQNLITI